MPIYAYRCQTCGFQQDVLQKMSDPRLVTCPSCGNDTFQKQVTAAGFQLKGSGWYVTDFRNPATKEGSKSDKSEASPAGDGKGDAGSVDKPAPSPAEAAAAPTAAPEAKPAPPSPKAPPAAGSN